MKICKTCIVRLGSYPDDPRVKKQVKALLENNFKIDLICTKSFKGQPIFERDGNLRIFRLPFNKLISDSVFVYFVLYFTSLLLIGFLLTFLSLINRYQTIQIHTLPDFLTFSSALPKLFGIKIVTDFHEPSPELILTKLGYHKQFLYKFAVRIEQMVIKYSDLSFTVTETLKKRFVQRGANSEKIIVVTNVIDDYDFLKARNLPKHKSEDFIIISHGSIEKRYGHELVIKAVNELKNEYPSIKFYICGYGSYETHLKKLTEELRCEDHVKFFGYLPFDELLNLLRNSDAGIISMPQTPYSELIDTNKLYEYIALGLPVIHSRLKPIEENFSDCCIKYYEPGNINDLKNVIVDLYRNPEKRADLVKNADLIYPELRWQVIKKEFVKSIVDLS